LPKLNLISHLQTFSRLSLLSLLALALSLLLVARPASGQSGIQTASATEAAKERQSPAEVLPDRLGENWRAAGEPRRLSSERFAVVDDSDVYLEYGLQAVITRSYTNGKDRIRVEAFEVRYPSGAHGLFTFNRGSLPPGRQEFHLGRYVVSLSREQEAASGEAAQFDPQLIEALSQQLSEGPVELSPLPAHLPERNKIAESEKYLVGPAALARLAPFSDLKGVISFTGGAEAATAEYDNGGGRMSLIIIEYYTPQLASTGFAQLNGFFGALSPQEKERRLIKRVGNYVVEAVNVRDAAAAEAILGEIKYTARVYWQGKKFTSIPLPFRPPDPMVLEEARRTAQFLVTVFYAVGLMLICAAVIGITSGGAIFYWRRYRRRKLGLEDAFSDAGGTIRLNLDDYLLPAAEKSPPKYLSKGD
jgi:hypothetical protein